MRKLHKGVDARKWGSRVSCQNLSATPRHPKQKLGQPINFVVVFLVGWGDERKVRSWSDYLILLSIWQKTGETQQNTEPIQKKVFNKDFREAPVV